jgi:cellobiose-specific phosphotransferase system IIC component
MMPIIIAGAAGVLLNNFPIKIYQNFMTEFFGENWRSFGGYVWNGTLAVLSMAIVFTLGHSLAERHNMKNPWNSIHPAIVALLSFCSLLTITEPTPEFAIPYNWMGIHGLFLAILIGILSAELFLRLYKLRMLRVRFFSMGAGAEISDVFSALIPAILTIAVFAIFKILIYLAGIKDIHSFVYNFIYMPFKGLGNTLSTAVLFNFVRQVLWFFGIHGSNALEPVMTEIYADAIQANEMAVSAGKPPSFIFTRTFFDTYISMGGAGNTLALLMALFMTKRKSSMRKIAQISLLPSIFNINETLLFGMPIVLNPIFFLPFIVTPIALTVISYYATRLGLVPISTSVITWTTPAFISGFAASGSYAGSVLQLFNLFVGFLIYLPFVRMAERIQRNRFDSTYNRLLDTSKSPGTQAPSLLERAGEIGWIARVLANDLLESIKKNELFLEYQPQVNCLTGRVVGVEALLRWKHASIGRIPPSLFILLAEEIDFINEIGLWVCEKSCLQMREWIDHGISDVVMSFNISVKQLADPDLPEKIKACIERHGLNASCMKAEVTESIGLSSDMGNNVLLQDLRLMGVKIAIDDFGMGHSSLVYLKQFPVSTIKLDGCLVQDITTSKISSDIVSSISELCRSMDIELLAEFVETESQAVTLKELGCNIFQGYLYSPPIPPEACEQAIRQGYRTY